MIFQPLGFINGGYINPPIGFNGGNGIPGWLSALVVLQKFDNFWPQAVVDHCRIEAVIQTGDPNAIPLCSGRLDRYWSSIPQSIWVRVVAMFFRYFFGMETPRKIGGRCSHPF